MAFIVKLLVIILLFHEGFGVIYRLNEEEYALMPPLNHFDDFEDCLHHTDGLYCIVDFALVSDTPSPLLEMIHDYSAHTTTHYNHTTLHHGVCVTSSCRKYYTHKASDLKYTLEACLNDSLWNNYRLKTKIIADISCQNNKKHMTIESADIVVAIVCLIIVLLNVIGSFYDVCSTENNGSKFLLCFSLRRNWKKLMAPAADGPDPRLQSLKGLHCIRSISTALVILAHSMMPCVLFGANTQFIENLYYNMAIQIPCNGPIIMQTFLIMSGFLLVYNMHLYAEKSKLTWTFVPKAILSRWLRLTPVYAIVLAFTATWMRHAGSGLLWEVSKSTYAKDREHNIANPTNVHLRILKLVDMESADCRRDWLYHFLYINNYRDDSHCFVASWYLATDTQLYIIGIIVWLMGKTKESRKLVLSLLFLAGLVLPALHVYFQDLDGVLISSPENIRTTLAFDPTFHEIYKRSHTNLSGYVIGLTLGHLVYHWQKKGLDMQKYKKYRIMYWSLVPIGFGVVVLGSSFYADRPRVSLVMRVIFAAFWKPLFGIIIASILAGMVFKYENLYRGFLESNIWTVFGRVSFCLYLVHSALLKYRTALRTVPIHMSYSLLVHNYAEILITTFAVAFPLWLLAEAPLEHLLKLGLGSRKKTKSS